MNGWKTKVSAGLSILFGLLGMATGNLDAATGMQFIVTGGGLLGLGHKIEKITKK